MTKTDDGIPGDYVITKDILDACIDVLLEGTSAVKAQLEARIAALEARPPVNFADAHKGVYEAGRTYTRGSLVTWGGSMWLAKADTTAKPGDPAIEARAWQLVVQRGKDGSDLRR